MNLYRTDPGLVVAQEFCWRKFFIAGRFRKYFYSDFDRGAAAFHFKQDPDEDPSCKGQYVLKVDENWLDELAESLDNETDLPQRCYLYKADGKSDEWLYIALESSKRPLKELTQ